LVYDLNLPSFLTSGPKWNVTRELTEIKSRLEVEGSSETRVTCAMVGTPRVLKPLLIGMAAASLWTAWRHICQYAFIFLAYHF
jgi:hypothetical protein